MPVRPADRAEFEAAYTAELDRLNALPMEDPLTQDDEDILQPDETWNRKQWLRHILATFRAADAVSVRVRRVRPRLR